MEDSVEDRQDLVLRLDRRARDERGDEAQITAMKIQNDVNFVKTRARRAESTGQMTTIRKTPVRY